MKISLIIPAFNEENRIAKSIRSIGDFFSKKNWEFEIIVVDDGSRDKTVEVVNREWDKIGGTKKLLQNSANRGKGYSVRKGMLEATGDYLIFTDADLSSPIEEAEKLIRVLEEGCSIVIASRALRNSQVEIHQNIVRETMGKIFNCLARFLTFKGIHDSQCGFKGFRREAAQRLFSLAKIDGFAFDAEIIYLAQKFGYSIKEIPVVWRNSPASKVHMISDPVNMILDLFRIRLYHLRDDIPPAKQ